MYPSIRCCGVYTSELGVLFQRKIGDEVWALPGGKPEGGETLHTCLKREFNEEFALQIKVGRCIAIIENTFSHDGEQRSEIGFYFQVTRPNELGTDLVVEYGLEYAWIKTEDMQSASILPAAVKIILTEQNHDNPQFHFL
jgi:ADP-ribose pyrophosphatase YjhB (NUDIX family)